jgi:putative PIN family toxin of toxin-antitoxin system
MIIVLDTNVLVAGLLSPFGPPGRILDLVLSGELELAYDDRILAEYHDVLARARFGFDRASVAELLAYIEAEEQHVTAMPLNVELPDPDDMPFLEVSRAVQADALVTGNIRHYPAASRHNVIVLTPAEFMQRWRADHAGNR